MLPRTTYIDAYLIAGKMVAIGAATSVVALPIALVTMLDSH